jgi:DmsE family decaheme c-type cytochrome
MTRLVSKMSLLVCALTLFVGTAHANEKCKECHADIVAKHATALHGKAGKGCEDCHGGTAAHLASGDKKDIISFGKGDVKVQNAQCLICHEKNQNLTFWNNSKHKSEDVACVSCHSIHKDSKPVAQQPDKCFECHKDVRSEANKYSHHPIIEGLVKCSDCHNPHGSLGHGSIKAENINQLCYKCHADKRGPYVWEHPPVEENCATCHKPHGSNSFKLLTEKEPRLCQNCHDANQHPGTILGSNRGFVPKGSATVKNNAGTATIVSPGDAAAGRGGLGRGCTGCHGSIHGSSSPATNGKTFIR